MEYIIFNRLLEAPPALVVAKFLSAHKQRAQRTIKAFSLFFATEASAPASGSESWADTQSRQLNDVRLFHQDFVLGMIEASRGVSSVCKDLTNSASRSNEDHSSIAVQAYDDLYATIAISLPDYTEALIRALSAFFHSYEEAVRSGEGNEAGSPIARAAGAEAPSSREEQRQRWISFARQVRHELICMHFICILSTYII